ncbi:MAG: alpha/beta hydrolase [Chitinophagaceae bacterium]
MRKGIALLLITWWFFQTARGQMIPIHLSLSSHFLHRRVLFHILLPSDFKGGQHYPLLVLNDGQDMKALGIKRILDSLLRLRVIPPILVVGVDAGNRLQEYGVAGHPDYAHRGSDAGAYTKFILMELMPALKIRFSIRKFNPSVIAGWSLGGLSAMDIAWNHPAHFSKVGVFSGSFWWRSKALGPGYTDQDRIMEAEVRKDKYKKGLKFWMEAGTHDETSDRNHNGMIDAIEDTRDLIGELEKKGYRSLQDIQYVEIKNGEHNISTWKKILPNFLIWAFGSNP